MKLAWQRRFALESGRENERLFRHWNQFNNALCFRLQKSRGELNEVIADIKEKMQAYGLTGSDIGLGGGLKRRKNPSSGSKTAPVIKYRGPNGETWSGGRGRKPNWVVEMLAAGKSLDDYAVGKRAER